MSQKLTLLSAIHNKALRYGNCRARADVLAERLWRFSKGINRIEVVSAINFDHVLVIVNREGELQKPATWGNAWCIDAWYKNGIIFHASEFAKQFKEIEKYANDQIAALKEIGIYPGRSCPEVKQETLSQIVDINPRKNRYPSHIEDSTLFGIEDYYESVTTFPKNFFVETSYKDRAETSLKFAKCLREIEKFEVKKLTKIR